MAPSDYTTTRNRGQSTTAVSNSVEMPPMSRFRENSDNPTITACSSAAAAQVLAAYPLQLLRKMGSRCHSLNQVATFQCS